LISFELIFKILLHLWYANEVEFILVFIFIFGLFIGSFLNVLADRLPRGETVVGGRSHCEVCKKELEWYDLIPLLSFAFLKGRCRYCHTRLSLRYPAVELTTGILFVLVYLFLARDSILYQVLSIKYLVELLYYLFIISCLIVVFFADLKYGIIPDKIIFPAIIISAIYLILNTQYLLPHVLSAVGACLFFLMLFLVTRGRGMGFGDVKFAFFMGLVLGYPNIIVGLYIAFLTGAIVGCILILWRKKKLKGASIPFGPFLVLGTVLAMFGGDFILQRIMSVLR
jgi:leader peptidase (prepilin peptidase) / N-methyltransferase